MSEVEAHLHALLLIELMTAVARDDEVEEGDFEYATRMPTAA